MTKRTFHKNLPVEHWQKLSLFEQLGNIGSEVGRALAAQKRMEKTKMDAALDRGLELFDLAIGDPKNRTHLKELCRAREVVCSFFFAGECYGYTPEALEKYFMSFAIAARMNR
jgi:hypothetical protein